MSTLQYIFIHRYTVNIAVDQWVYCNFLGGIGYRIWEWRLEKKWREDCPAYQVEAFRGLADPRDIFPCQPQLGQSPFFRGQSGLWRDTSSIPQLQTSNTVDNRWVYVWGCALQSTIKVGDNRDFAVSQV